MLHQAFSLYQDIVPDVEEDEMMWEMLLIRW